MIRRIYTPNRKSDIERAKKIRETFYDEPANKITPVSWTWPRRMQHVGTCEAVMYSSDKWREKVPVDYKHIAEGNQNLLLTPGSVIFAEDDDDFVGPMLELPRPMPEGFAVLAKILGIQARLHEGTPDDYGIPDRGGYYQINLAGWLGATKHPETGQMMLIVYTQAGVHALVTGEVLDVEKDGITG